MSRARTNFDGEPWSYGEVLFVVRNCLLPDPKTGRRRMTVDGAARAIGRSYPSVASLLRLAKPMVLEGRSSLWELGSSLYRAASQV